MNNSENKRNILPTTTKKSTTGPTNTRIRRLSLQQPSKTQPSLPSPSLRHRRSSSLLPFPSQTTSSRPKESPLDSNKKISRRPFELEGRNHDNRRRSNMYPDDQVRPVKTTMRSQSMPDVVHIRVDELISQLTALSLPNPVPPLPASDEFRMAMKDMEKFTLSSNKVDGESRAVIKKVEVVAVPAAVLQVKKRQFQRRGSLPIHPEERRY